MINRARALRGGNGGFRRRAQAAKMEIGTIVVMNPNYLDEVRATVRAAGIAAQIATRRFSEL